MKKKIKSYMIALNLLALASCSDYLEIIPRDQISDASVW